MKKPKPSTTTRAVTRLLTSEELTSRLLTKEELARYLNTTTRSIERWMADREIPFYKQRGTVRFDLAQVKAALQPTQQKAEV